MQPISHRKVALMVSVNGKCHFKEIDVVRGERTLQEEQAMDRLYCVFGSTSIIEIMEWHYIT
ncbi:hypothetical protein phiOC_p314 [Ochrobactrum phage vB_OspM_OC]|nr:hypothetical protein phiOC_p314 [Ochrobactrum phage vB_OspM_OC]